MGTYLSLSFSWIMPSLIVLVPSIRQPGGEGQPLACATIVTAAAQVCVLTTSLIALQTSVPFCSCAVTNLVPCSFSCRSRIPDHTATFSDYASGVMQMLCQ